MGAHLWRYRSLIGQLVRRELKLRYNRSLLGLLWSLITPAAVLLIYMVVFGIFLRVEPPDAGVGIKSYPLFMLCGLVVWDLFAFVIKGSTVWLTAARPLLRNVYLPPDVPVVAGALSTLSQAGMQLSVLLIVFLILGNVALSFLVVPFLICLVLMFSLGLGLIVACLHIQFRDTEHLVNIALTLLFFTTPVLYPLSLVPHEIWNGFPIKDVIEMNPLTTFVEEVRGSLYLLDSPSLSSLIQLTIISVAFFYVGLFFFNRRAGRIGEEV